MATIQEKDVAFSRGYMILDAAVQSAVDVLTTTMQKELVKPSSGAWLVLSGLKGKLLEAQQRAGTSVALRAGELIDE